MVAACCAWAFTMSPDRGPSGVRRVGGPNLRRRGAGLGLGVGTLRGFELRAPRIGRTLLGGDERREHDEQHAQHDEENRGARGEGRQSAGARHPRGDHPECVIHSGEVSDACPRRGEAQAGVGQEGEEALSATVPVQVVPLPYVTPAAVICA